MRSIEIRFLIPLPTLAHSTPRQWLQGLSDAALLESARNPRNDDFLIINIRTGFLHDGNGRAHELLRRAADPNSTISPEDAVPVGEYLPDLTMFPDLE
jgi:hypothetical protein